MIKDLVYTKLKSLNIHIYEDIISYDETSTMSGTTVTIHINYNGIIVLLNKSDEITNVDILTNRFYGYLTRDFEDGVKSWNDIIDEINCKLDGIKKLQNKL